MKAILVAVLLAACLAAAIAAIKLLLAAGTLVLAAVAFGALALSLTK